MVKLKDIEITYDNKEEHKNKNIYVEINGKLKETVWVSNIGNIIVLHTKR